MYFIYKIVVVVIKRVSVKSLTFRAKMAFLWPFEPVNFEVYK